MSAKSAASQSRPADRKSNIANRKCLGCGKPMSKHLGIWGTCAELQRLRAENHALQVLIDDAKAARKLLDLENHVLLKENLRLTREVIFYKTLFNSFKLLMFLKIIPPGQDHTVANLLHHLKKILRRK